MGLGAKTFEIHCQKFSAYSVWLKTLFHNNEFLLRVNVMKVTGSPIFSVAPSISRDGKEERMPA